MNRIFNFLFPALMLLGMFTSGFVIVASLQAAVAPISPPAPVANTTATNSNVLVAQGRALFIAKGCLVCHRYDDLAAARRAMGDFDFDNVPNLSNLKIDAAYLKRWLHDPQVIKPATTMPNLHLSAGEIDALAAFLLPNAPRNSAACPVTRKTAQVFVPPAPYPQVAPYGNFWYGSASLWLMLPSDGTWAQLRFGDKMFWWSSGYTASAEPKPALKISGKRLDGNETFEISDATNAYHSDFGGWAMLTGVQVPTSGCWEIRGEYHKTSTAFVVQVLP